MRKVVLGIFVLFVGASMVYATPVFSLETGADFQSAIDLGNIKPATVATDDLLDHYPPPYEFSPPELFVYGGEPSDPDGGLVMAWGDDQDTEYFSQWQYTYTEDPNLVGLTLSALALAPPGINSISLGIYEAVNPVAGSKVRSWTWTVGPPASGAAITQGVPTWISATIAPMGLGGIAETGALGPVATGFFDNGVDPTKIQTLGFDENGNWVRFANSVPGTQPPQFQPWNYWLAVQVTPEPATLGLLVLGGLALLRRRR